MFSEFVRHSASSAEADCLLTCYYLAINAMCSHIYYLITP